MWIQLIAMAIQLYQTLNSEKPQADKDAQVTKSLTLLDKLFPKAQIKDSIGAISSDDVKTIVNFLFQPKSK
jgi:hypothetical protein